MVPQLRLWRFEARHDTLRCTVAAQTSGGQTSRSTKHPTHGFCRESRQCGDAHLPVSRLPPHARHLPRGRPLHDHTVAGSHPLSIRRYTATHRRKQRATGHRHRHPAPLLRAVPACPYPLLARPSWQPCGRMAGWGQQAVQRVGGAGGCVCGVSAVGGVVPGAGDIWPACGGCAVAGGSAALLDDHERGAVGVGRGVCQGASVDSAGRWPSWRRLWCRRSAERQPEREASESRFVRMCVRSVCARVCRACVCSYAWSIPVGWFSS
mmetsp:Transcript_34122/g.98284  ORF Transcript_34122/g.98284 Transcript_34122/m.98284 type:complete len:265 (+) Transcript_34122:882-1676(+)